MTARLSRARRATPEVLVEYLSERQIKEVCEAVGLEPRGRRAALIATLLAPPAMAGRSDLPARPPARRNGGDGDTRWSKPHEVSMKEETPAKMPLAPSIDSVSAPTRVARTELVWPGKYDEHGALVEPPRVTLPFQVIEVIKEGRTSREALAQTTLPLFGAKPKGASEDGWRNKLVWGENLYVLSSLLSDFAGRVDLIYIDPPFATGADFSVTTQIGEDGPEVEREGSLIEEKAYRDTWGRGNDSYVAMLFQRFLLARELLSERGLMFVHIGPNVNHLVRLLLDEVFGSANHRNEISWKRTYAHSDARRFGIVHDSILLYSRTDNYRFFKQHRPHDESYIRSHYGQVDENGRRFRLVTLSAAGPGPARRFGDRVIEPPPGRHWAWEQARIDEGLRTGKIVFAKTGQPNIKQYLDETQGTVVQSIWDDIPPVNPVSAELLGYPTQKPEALLERIIKASTEPGDLVLDFFCGSGTTLAVAEKLGRRWIGCDLGHYAVHTTRKRLLELRVKDAATGEERGARPFEILNLGRYERKYWQGITFGNEPKNDVETALAAYVKFILELYKAQPIQGAHVHGKKGGALVHVGAVDAPVTIAQIEDAVAETKQRGVRELHVLAWEWEMGLFDPLTKLAKAQHGIEVRLLSIPREVMEKRAVEAGDVQFFDLAYLEIEAKPGGSGPKASRSVKIRLKDFVIPSTDLIPEEVRNKIRKWSDYIDYWAVDWDFRNDTFMSQWQSYRTRRDRKLELESPVHTYPGPGTYQVLVKVIDIFGNDTSHLVRWEAK